MQNSDCYKISFLACFIACLSCSNNNDIHTAEDFGSLKGKFILDGDPASDKGAKWSYQEEGDVIYDLEGILYKPSGDGPFPAVIINHGTGGSAYEFGNKVAQTMASWGYVGIATNYTHSSSVPCGSPGSCNQDDGDFGASNANILRAAKCMAILKSLSYIDVNRLVAFGNSRGAFLTTALAGTYPDSFKAFAHSSGGVSEEAGSTAPSILLAEQITKPYLMHHSEDDMVIDLSWDEQLRDILNENEVTNSLYIYQGLTHQEMSKDEIMIQRTREWFEEYNP